MTTTPLLQTLLKDSPYKLTQFSSAQIQTLENSIILKEKRGKQIPHVICLVRNKEIELKPEEIVRQLYLMVLTQDLSYPISRIAIEYGVTFGRETKRADICIFDKDRPTVPYILVELKKPKLKDGKEQLKSYCNATGAPIAVWTNGDLIEYYQRKDPNHFDNISNIPNASQSLEDVLLDKNKRFSILNLIIEDKLKSKSLQNIIEELEDEVLANAGVDVFEEAFKLIFSKLYDEFLSGKDKDSINHWLNFNPDKILKEFPNEIAKGFRTLEFRNKIVEAETKKAIENLFENAKKKWGGIFVEGSTIQLSPSHLQTCVSYLENIKLFNSNLEVVDEAFEYLVNKDSKGDKGQYFTPRYVIDMCVKMLNPQPHEYMIDTAAGSCGFPVHTIFHVWQQLCPDKNNLFTTDEKTQQQEDYVKEKIFAIDFDLKAVRVGRTLNLIAGDGESNVLHLNSLDYERWEIDNFHNENWRKTFIKGFDKIKELAQKKNDFKYFDFDILMANPPFAGEIKEPRLIRKYELTEKGNGKYIEKISRDILFIERNLNFLRDGGRMAVVLPQGRFNNSSDKFIRDFIAERCRILAVVGLHGNTFKPHTGTKTSVLFLQKWTDENGICPRKADYPIFFATQTKEGKNNSGEKLYWKIDGSTTTSTELALYDKYHHPIVYHDLFSTETLSEKTPEGIAEAFILFAKNQGLSFVPKSEDLTGFKNLSGLYASPFNEMKYRALLERLEVSEVMFSRVDLGDRFDAEYFWKDSLHIQELLEAKGAIKFNEIGDFVASAFYPAATHLYESGDTPFVRCVDCINYPLITKEQNDSFEKIPLSFANENGGVNLLEKGDFVITKVGSPCYASIVEEHELVALSRTVLGVKNIKNIDSYYLLVFLRGRYGFNQLLRQRELTIQYQLTLARVKNIQIYIAGLELQKKIHELIDVYNQKKQQAKSTYSQAENLLLNALGMADFSPSTKNTNEKSFKDSFLATGRLDAEYYQPKYEEMMAHIAAQNHSTLAALVSIQKSIEPGSDAYSEDEEGLPFLRVADYNKFGITEPQKKLSLSFVAENIEKLNELKPKAGAILFSKDGSVGEAYCLSEDANFITSGAILHLTVRDKNKVLPDYLTLALNSKLIKMQSERDAGGSIILHWRISEIENVIVPIVDMAIQNQIADLIQQSFSLKVESERLLETAKRACEIAIETDEQTAMDFINTQTGE